MLCSYCGKTYSSKKTYLKHVKLKHDPNFSFSKLNFYTCFHCHQEFHTKIAIKNHIFKLHLHSRNSNTQRVRKQIKCADVDCKECFSSYKRYIFHLKDHHKLEMEEEKLTFNSPTDFEQWKNTSILGAHYVKEFGTRLYGAKKIDYLRCNRSYTPRITSGKRTKFRGSRKIGSACPSNIRVVSTGKQISVHFVKTHFGHTCDVAYIPLRLDEKKKIADKVAAGVTFERILDDIQDTADPDNPQFQLERVHLVDKKDIYNISKQFNINSNIRKHNNDAVSVKITIREIQEHAKDKNPILYFKDQSNLIDSTEQSEFLPQDFVLVIMTSFQEKLLRYFGQNYICIDGTHGLNAYDFYLYSLVIIDEFGNGVPVAFCISNRKDTALFVKFFSLLKERVGIITTNVFMSDAAEAFYNGWLSIMGPAKNRLRCWWHIAKNWTKNSSKIRNNEKRVLVKNTLYSLLREVDKEKFHNSLTTFVQMLMEDSETEEFGKYFERQYIHKIEEWALCYRTHIGLNTNMVLESLHKKIKYTYLSGLVCHRLDKSLHALFRLINKEKYTRVIKIKRQKPLKKIEAIMCNHDRSFTIQESEISTKHVIESEEGIPSPVWCVRSYEVSRITDKCPESLCALKCSVCLNVCIHTYTCTCIDNIVTLNICKHIHAVSRYIRNHADTSIQTGTSVETVDRYINNENEVRELLFDNDHITIPNSSSNVDTFDHKSQILAKLQELSELAKQKPLIGKSGLLIQRYCDKMFDAFEKISDDNHPPR